MTMESIMAKKIMEDINGFDLLIKSCLQLWTAFLLFANGHSLSIVILLSN